MTGPARQHSPPTEVAGTAEESTIYWARAIGSAHLRKPEEVRKDLAAIESLHQKLVAEKSEFADAVEDDRKEAQAWLAFAEGKDDDAVEAMRPIADKEDSLGDEPEGIPAREMIADMLLEAKRPQQALVEYQTDLKLNPNRFDGLYGAARAAEAAGKQNDATEYYALLLKVCGGSNSTRPELGEARKLVAQKIRTASDFLAPTYILGSLRRANLKSSAQPSWPTAPSSALYSRCFKYKSKENPAWPFHCQLHMPSSRGNILGTRCAYSSNSGNFAAENLLRRESPEYRWRRTSPPAQCPPTNSAPPRQIPTPSAAIPNKADCAYKHTARKWPALHFCAHDPKPGHESRAPAQPKSHPAPSIATSAAPARNKARANRNPSGTRIRRAIFDHSAMQTIRDFALQSAAASARSAKRPK